MEWTKLLSDFRIRESTRGKDSRNEFESDFGRIIFSPALRRMHDKTQVFPLTEDDNIHSRLTHSMEVMAIGHSLGIRVCEDEYFIKAVGKTKTFLYREIPIILKNACLIHDIGNPPFGHFGETVIQTYFKSFFTKNCNLKLSKREKEDFVFFDGNAQGFRVVTKLQILNDKYGLNLTAATLGTFLKYPNYEANNDTKIFRKKRGVFQSEIDYLKVISVECGLILHEDIVRHPLCYLMEAADSICYSVMDIEDGFNKGWYRFEFIVSKLSHIKEVKEAIDEIKKSVLGVGEEVTRMVKLRIFLIRYLVELAARNFLEKYDVILKGEYHIELIVDDPNNLFIELQQFAYKYIFPTREITSLELTGHSVITGLMDIYTEFIFHSVKSYKKRAEGLISDSIIRAAFEENKDLIYEKRLEEIYLKYLKEDDEIKKNELINKYESLKELIQTLKDLKTENFVEENELRKIQIITLNDKIYKTVKPVLDDLTDYYKLRVIVDYISGMTDQFALSQYQKLSGQKII